MMREGLHKFTLNNDNRHLLDLFYQNGTYLELGSIDYDVLTRLLNFELIDCDDLSYFPIQKQGLGRFEVENDNLRKVLPFLFFERLHQKNKNNQLFITYGLLHHKDEHNREIFSPLALLPVNLYFEDGRIFIQQISRPIENTCLINYLMNEKNVEIASAEKIDSPYALDRYCFSFEKYGLSVKLENYLTFAALKEPEMKLERSLFDHDGGYPDYLSDCLYDSAYPELYYSRQLSRKQRQAVYKGASGDNLVIAGRLGTGKTTTLFNIAMNAILSGKRVLYVSNMKETLEQIYSLFEKLGLNQYLTDFTNSFASFHQNKSSWIPAGESEPVPDTDKLQQNYRFIKKYVHAVTGRILDFRFIDVVNKLASIADFPKVKLEIDDLSELYKNEYLEIVSALKKIEENLKKIGHFKNSIWKEIPVFNNIKYPNQIFTLIYQVQKNFLILQDKKEILEKQFGLKSISNYAYLKSVFHDLKGLDINAFPLSWVNQETFSQARDEFKILKSQIYQIQELEYLLESRYMHPESLDIETEMQALFGPFFKEDDLDKIDRLLKEQAVLKVIINKIDVQNKIFLNNKKKIAALLNWDFPQSNYVLEEIMNLNGIIQTMDFSPEFLGIVSAENYEEISEKLQKLADEIKAAEAESENLFNAGDFGKGASIEKNISDLEKFVANKPVKKSAQRLFANLKKEKPDVYTSLQKKAKKYRELKDLLSELQDKFYKLTGFYYEDVILENLHRFYFYFYNLSDKLIKSKFLKFLKSVVRITPEDSKWKRNYRNLFDLFSRAYFLINNYYRELLEYGFKSEEAEFSDKLKDIDQIAKYFENLLLSNERIRKIKKDASSEYVSAVEYRDLYKLVSEINAKKTALKENRKYRYLYGKLYADYKTNINNISRFLQAFKVYSDCFDNEEKLIESLNPDTHGELFKHLEFCEEASDNLAEVFKIYFKIFKDSVSKYYYSSFDEILDLLNRLVNSKDELISYLAVTENLKILQRYGLTKLIDLILNLDDSENLTLNFQYTYLDTIRQVYLEKHPYLSDYHVLENCLEATMNYEKDRIALVERQASENIRRESNNKFNPLGIKNLDYSGYVRKTAGTKHVFLTDTQILNNFLNPGDFDLILIDDAHLLNANHYSKALQGKQIIVAGEQQLLSSVANNLISRVSNNKAIILDFRFLPTPRKLLMHMPGLRGLTFSTVSSNLGIEIISEKLPELILDLLSENKDCVINVFLADVEKQKLLYERLANLFLDRNYSEEEILLTYKKRLNICDLSYEYLFDADYNLVFLDEYYRVELDYEVANLIDLLMLCKKKLIIYDEKNLLESDLETKFLTEIRKISAPQDIYSPKEAKGMVTELVNRLREAGIKVYSSSVFSLLLQKQNKYYGVLIFWDEENADYEILNEYRDNYLLCKDTIKIYVVWSLELMESSKKVAVRILKGMNDA